MNHFLSMTSSPRISVIIAVFNGAKHLSAQMDALLAQRCDFPWEAIYVDNGSTDTSRELISARISEDNLSHVHLIDGSQERGQVYARNHGGRLARTSLLAYTDQDDLPAPDWVTEMVKALQNSDAIAGGIIYTPHGYALVNNQDTGQEPPRSLKCWNGFDYALGTNFGVHRHVLEALGGWQELGVHAGEDVDLCIRLKLAGYKISYAPMVRVTWRSRIEIGDIFRQGVTYGRSDVLLYLKFRKHGVQRRSLRSMLRVIKQTLQPLGGLFQTPRSYWGVIKLGVLTGRLLQCLRSRTLYI
ncbi:hypothetical protein IMCC26134_08025 [Verrucomicrobia bacterium IMCC26134]|nr:hypothetical protein IMCC26134_08025 [Verrucomicrobia bacterium IMCC26134]